MKGIDAFDFFSVIEHNQTRDAKHGFFLGERAIVIDIELGKC